VASRETTPDGVVQDRGFRGEPQRAITGIVELTEGLAPVQNSGNRLGQLHDDARTACAQVGRA
jgi:hypothetical protein